VSVYSLNGDNSLSIIGTKDLAHGTDWLSDEKVTIGDDVYYRVATNEYVKASQVYPYKLVNMNMRTNDNFGRQLYRADGTLIPNRTLAQNADFSTDRIAYINGEQFYRVNPDEFVKADNAYEVSTADIGGHKFADRGNIATFSDQPDVQAYRQDSNNVMSYVGTRVLPHTTDWLTDQKLTIGNDTYYRVASNEYVKASQVYPYEYSHANIRTTSTSNKNLYTAEGKLIANRQLAANSDWRTDRVMYIDGVEYYRVATNEFVRADDIYIY